MYDSLPKHVTGQVDIFRDRDLIRISLIDIAENCVLDWLYFRLSKTDDVESFRKAWRIYVRMLRKYGVF